MNLMMGHFCRLTIILVSLLSALAVPVKKFGQSVNPLTPVVDPTDSDDIVYLNQNGQWITRDVEVTLLEKLARMVASKFILDATIQFKLGRRATNLNRMAASDVNSDATIRACIAGSVIDTRTNPIFPIDQPPNSIQPGVTINQFGQFVTPSGQIVTLIENGQYLKQDSQVLDQNGNPIV
ncbi:hypothetical protein PCASD_01213 [Puccinia coronata f. sp. avenae]|uniref:Uncharacterized protein n=1 Tax=Puccinia coronata f. sp. avenae TaxID=200324 RepID=A0A2N5VLY5_9BASI|nr:hypothetical protein PCASD_01213 [Puccinia coronata f. sp. avenae]